MGKSTIAVVVSAIIGVALQSLTLVTFLGFSDAPGGQVSNSYIYFMPGLLSFTVAPLVGWLMSKSWKVVLTTVLILVVTYLLFWFIFTTPLEPIKQA